MEIAPIIDKAAADHKCTIRDNSSYGTERRRITFPNGYQLSVISGEFAYCTPGETVEVAIFDPSGDWVLDDDKGDVDQVVGHVSPEEIALLWHLIASANVDGIHAWARERDRVDDFERLDSAFSVIASSLSRAVTSPSSETPAHR